MPEPLDFLKNAIIITKLAFNRTLLMNTNALRLMQDLCSFCLFKCRIQYNFTLKNLLGWLQRVGVAEDKKFELEF